MPTVQNGSIKTNVAASVTWSRQCSRGCRVSLKLATFNLGAVGRRKQKNIINKTETLQLDAAATIKTETSTYIEKDGVCRRHSTLQSASILWIAA